MKTKRHPFQWPLMAVVAVAALAAGYAIGSHERYVAGGLQQTQGDADSDSEIAHFEPQIQDAIHRWSVKSHLTEESIRQIHRPRAMFIPTRNQGQGMLCIELRLKPGNVGGSPVYCYQDDFFKPDERMSLIAEYSDVE